MNIVLHGMNERAYNTFTALFSSAQWTDCRLADRVPPDLGIVDLDTPAPERTWQEYRRRHPELPTLVLSIREQRRDNAQHLQKPVSASTLRRIIDQMRTDLDKRRAASATRGAAPPRAFGGERPPAARPSTAESPRSTGGTQLASQAPRPLVERSRVGAQGGSGAPITAARKTRTHAPFAARAPEPGATSTRAATRLLDPERAEHYCGKEGNVPLHDLAAISRIVYDPRRYFQGALERAIVATRRSGQAHAIGGLGGYYIVMPGPPVSVVTTIGEAALRSICLMPFEAGKLHVSLATAGDLEAVADAKPVRDESAMWEVALWSGRGRLRRSIAIDTPVQLVQWPNFTRLVETPEAMRIAAALASGPSTPYALAARLGVAQRYVFSFVSAARAIGLIERVALDSDALGGDTLSQMSIGVPDSTGAPRHAVPTRAPNSAAPRNAAPRPLLARILSRILSRD